MGGAGRYITVRRILGSSFVAADRLIHVSRERQAPDDSIGLRYPIREYQGGQSSSFSAPSFRFLYMLSKKE